MLVDKMVTFGLDVINAVNECFWIVFFSCTVHQAETPGPPALIRRRRSWWKPRRWLPGYSNRGVAPAALPSPVWSEGSQWGRAGADWRLPQDTLPRYEGSEGLVETPASVALLNQAETTLFFRFPPGALPRGARTTSVPWKTGHSYGQDLSRLGGVGQDHGEFSCWLHSGSGLRLLR